MNRAIAALAGVAVAFFTLIMFVTIFLLDDDSSCSSKAPDLGQGLPSANGVTLAGLNASQLGIGKLIVQIGEQRHVSSNGIIAALSAAIQESTLRNLSNSSVQGSDSYANDGVSHDYDSVGPWQMRVSIYGPNAPGAGPHYSLADLMNPAVQANWFYDKLTHIDGWETREPGDLAAEVENPRADLAGNYAPHAAMARAIYNRFKGSGGSPDSGYSQCSPGTGTTTPPGDFNAKVLAAAKKWLGTPYVWGGGDANGPTNGGFDCSGLVLYAVAQASGGTISLPHYTQFQQDDPRGRSITYAELAPGDVVYFTKPGEHDSHHVGIYAGNGQLLHAPDTGDQVKYSPLSAFKDEQMSFRRFGSAPAAATAGTGTSPSSSTEPRTPGGPHD